MKTNMFLALLLAAALTAGTATAQPAHTQHVQHRHHNRDQRIGKLVPQRHAQSHGVESALAQVADIGIQLAEVHFLRLQAFLLEVIRFFMNLVETRIDEIAVLGYVRAAQRATTSGLRVNTAGKRLKSRSAVDLYLPLGSCD